MGKEVGCKLKCIYLEHNLISKDFEYRKKLKNLVPSLIQVIYLFISCSMLTPVVYIYIYKTILMYNRLMLHIVKLNEQR